MARPLADRDLAAPSGLLVSAVLVACLFPGWAFLRAVYLSIHFEPTSVALYAARVGHRLGAVVGVALLVLLAVAAGIHWTAPSRSRSLTAGVAVAVSAVLGVTGLAWVSADRALHPFGPEEEALAAFVPPPGAEHNFDVGKASDHPELTRYWGLPGSVPETCAPAVARFERGPAPAP